MARSTSVEQTLARLHALRGQAALPEVRAELRKALGNRVNLVVAKAATIVEEAGANDLASDLVAAFDRFMQKPAETDRGCAAKIAAAKALYTLGIDTEPVFLAGIRHVQLEGSFGQPVDTAAELRAVCALGLVRMGYRDVTPLLVDLLADPQMQARIGAIRAIAYADRPEGEPLLRLKLLLGDAEPDVMAEGFAALLRLSAGRNIEFIGRFLGDADESIREAAALAIGESRQPRGFDLLRQHWQETRDAFLLLPIALTRRPEAIELLMDLLAQAPASLARRTLESLAIFRHDDAIRQRAGSAVAGRNEPALVSALRTVFG